MLDIDRLSSNTQDIQRRLWWRGEEVDLTSLLQLYRKAQEGTLSESAKADAVGQVQAALIRLPAIPHETVPLSREKTGFKVIREYLERPTVSDVPSHEDIATALVLLDFKRSAKLSGSKFHMYVGLGAQLERALITYMLNKAYQMGYTLVGPCLPWAPTESVFTAGVLPKFQDQVYHLVDTDLFLVPTAEIILSSLHNGDVVEEKQLPLRYAAYTCCYRREAGAAGAAEPGLIRVHQFNKVELFRFTRREMSYEELEALVQDCESVLRGLDLHYRVVLLPSCDLAQQATKAYDLQVWLPSMQNYYEVSSISNCEDYQARRGNARYFSNVSGKAEYLHTLNGSGLATSRLFAAILENNRQKDGSVIVPKVLRPLMGGIERISKA